MPSEESGCIVKDDDELFMGELPNSSDPLVILPGELAGLIQGGLLLVDTSLRTGEVGRFSKGFQSKSKFSGGLSIV